MIPPALAPLPRSFFDRGAAQVGRQLVGALLVGRTPEGALRVARVVETEAYLGEHDLACHARAGRTGRTEVMYGPPGHAYVYLIYGLHQMLNLVCGPGGHPCAVLLRAAEPLDERTAAQLDPAGVGWAPWLHHSATGPANLCRAFGVLREHNRADLCDAGAPLWLAAAPAFAPKPKLWAGPRVGVDYAGTWAAEPLRFCDAASPAVSKPRPNRSAPRGAQPRPPRVKKRP